MARVGGRSTWFAWFAGLLMAGAVAWLVWLAVPMTPVVADWAGQALRGDLLPTPAARPVLPDPTPTPEVAPPPAPVSPTFPSRCEELFPEGLWQRLTDDPVLTLDAGVSAASPSVGDLAGALDARTLIGCAFAGDGGHSVTTLATVSDQGVAHASALLGASGFDCRDDGGGVRCERPVSDDADAEVHVVRGGLWLASIRSYPGPPTELSSTIALVWP